MSKFKKWRWATGLLSALVVACGVWCCLPEPAAPAAPWEKVEPRLRQFDQSADAAANKRLQSVHLFFKQREPGAKKFGGDANCHPTFRPRYIVDAGWSAVVRLRTTDSSGAFPKTNHDP
jgi:hypothetical protein